mmetsp:Transcript_15200/g.21334  ORF Transcript_15200/g.21334 Transcript_15200/m.21334 type:complete len:427 (+) Transcript_15200:75-1355(+)|eukprot:CAMPEP_0184482056 /NCGR_PEP_ID=MMETSP0113_2-20130426/3626_1 /TAXON_ID=91329 /ORGANISM="Norrisiella sphaerica, Strain BC52" /LENGTH=426 /DNA_ID=CAMNT_0026861569 /DNA_START=75 /DNA_END=1355 /DNA_ORIENTATION=+
MSSKNVPAVALVAADTSGQLRASEIERRKPGADDVLIKISHCGICHTDLHELRGEWPIPNYYPMVPGHEIVGTVESIGENVKDFKEGDRVGVGFICDSCSSCEYCKIGEEQYCAQGATQTFNTLVSDNKNPRVKNHSMGEVTHGGFSTKITVDKNYVVTIPQDLEMAKSAPLLCAGITVYSPLVYYGAKKGGKGFKTAVVGFGGLGHLAVKMATAMGNDVTVISRSHNKEEQAHSAGAKGLISSSDPDDMKSNQAKFDLIVDTVSGPHPVREYLSLLKPHGTMCLLGVPPKAFELMAMDLIFGRKKLGGSMIGGIKETQEMLNFCAEHNIAPDVESIAAEDVNEAFYKLSRGTNKAPRYVIDMSTLSEETKVKEEPRVDITAWKVTAQVHPAESNLHKSTTSKMKSKVNKHFTKLTQQAKGMFPSS